MAQTRQLAMMWRLVLCCTIARQIISRGCAGDGWRGGFGKKTGSLVALCIVTLGIPHPLPPAALIRGKSVWDVWLMLHHVT